jgi:DNA polymerase-3 subunit delta
VKANAGQIRTALGRPSPDIRLYLLHGPDEAGASDLARVLAKAVGADAERVDLDGATLRGDPARLADEAASLSLFGGARFIRVSPVGEEAFEALAALLSADRAGNPVVAIAPTVKATGKIVKLAIDSPHAMAHACYVPTGADAEKLVAAMARDHGLRPVGHAARRIADGTGGDRSVMLREIEKLALYLDADTDRPRELDDAAIDAVGADLGEPEMTEAVAALIDGRADALGGELLRLDAGGTSPIPWLRALARRLLALSDMRAEIDRGETPEAVMKRHRVFFREEAATARALRRWTPTMLAAALSRVRKAERAIMAPGNAGSVLAESAIVGLARDVGRRR